MTGDSLGVMLVLTLGGLVIPIAMLLMAAMIEVIALVWALFRYWHDDLTPALVRLAGRTTGLAAIRLHPRG